MECEIAGCECEARLLRLEVGGRTTYCQLCDTHIEEFIDYQMMRRTSRPEPLEQELAYSRWLQTASSAETR